MSLHRRDEDFAQLYELILAMVRKTFREDWDPVGVANHPTAYDEYDSYAPGVATMLMHGVDGEAWLGRRDQIVAQIGCSGEDGGLNAAGVFVLLRRQAAAIAEEFYG